MEPGLGRVAELGVMRAAFARVCTGHGQVLLLAGEAGVGKSHLVRAFLQGCGEGRVLPLHVARSQDAGPAPLTPVARLADTLASDPSGAAAAGELAVAVRSGRKEWEVRRLFDELVAVLAARVPVLVTLHVSRHTARGLVDAVLHVARRSRARRVMTVLMTRSEDGRLDELLHRTDAFLVPVDPFDAAGAEALVRAVAGADLEDATVRRIVERAGGNPGVIAGMCDAALSGAEPSSLLGRRIAGLSSRAIDVLRVAATCPEPVSGRFCALVCGRDPEDESPVSELERAGLVSIASDGALELGSPALAEVVLAGTPAPEKRRIERSTANLLAALGADPALVAHHALSSAEAGDPFAAAAVERALHAAAKLLRAGSPEAALDLTARAAALTPDGGDTAARLATTEAEAMLHLGRNTDAGRAFEHAISLGAGDDAVLGLARALQRGGRLEESLCVFARCHGTGAARGRSEVLLGLGRTAEAAAAAAAAVARARDENCGHMLAAALADQALAEAVRNRPGAVDLATEAVDLWRCLGEDSLDWPPLFALGVALEAADRFADSLRALGELRRWLDGRGLLDLVPRSVRSETIAAFLSCDWTRMEEAAASAIDVKRGLPSHEMGPIWASLATLAAGRGDEAGWKRSLARSEEALSEQATAFDGALAAWWRMIGHTFRLEFGPACDAGTAAVRQFRDIGALDFLARTLPSVVLVAGMGGGRDPALPVEYRELARGSRRPSIRAGAAMIEAAEAGERHGAAKHLVDAAHSYRQGEHRFGMLMSVLGAGLADPVAVPRDMRAECENLVAALCLDNALVASSRSRP